MKKIKRLLATFLAVVMLITTTSIAFVSYAVDDYTKDFDLQIYYYNADKNFVEVTEQIQVEEQKDIQLYAVLVYSDGTKWDITTSGLPYGMEGYSVEWHSDARYLAFCEKNDGKIHGYDATKGEAIRNWINNEVATTPVVGEALAKAILAALESGAYDIDDLDTEDVIKILSGLCDKLNVSEETKTKLCNSVADYLNKYDVGISAILRDADGNVVDSDTIRLLVLKASNLLSDVIPNAAFIKNYDNIPSKVAVGYEMDLEGIITPVRTHYSCTWTVTGQLGVLGSDLASVDENGHFVALNEGTIKVKVSPDINGMIDKLRKAFDALQKAGELVDNEAIAKAILLILGIKPGTDNYETLVSIVNRILDSDAAGNIDLSDSNLSSLANFILYVIYQDEVTIQIVSPDKIPVISYDVVGDTSITEGETQTYSFTNVKPDGAVPHNYTVSVENEEYAVQTEENGMTVLGIDGSTWNNNYVTPNKTNLTVDMEGLIRSKELSIYGKNNKKIIYIKIGADEYLPVNEEKTVNATTYPKRLTPSLQYGWIKEDGSYNFATAEQPAYTDDGLAYVTNDGVMYATGCTVNDLVVQDADGATATKQIMSGIQTTGVKFTKKHFWYKANAGTISSGIRGSVCEIYANILPANASFNNLTFTSSDTESVIISANPLTTSQYASAALTADRRSKYASATVTCDENGKATVYAYAIGNDACCADITVKSQTGGFTDDATVAFANLSVTDVIVTAEEDADYLQEDGTYLVTAGDILDFKAEVKFSSTTSLKNQGFEDVDWSVDNSDLASLNQAGVFKGLDVGTVTVTATSVFGEVAKSVSVRILPNYKELIAAIDGCDYDNLDSYDWSYASWDKFDALYKEAVEKLSGNLFTSQREVDQLAYNLKTAFEGLVRYIPLEKLEIACDDDSDGNGFATIAVNVVSNYTNYSTTIKSTVYPLEAEDYKVVYTSSDTSKITVDENGVCKPVSSSDSAWAKITATVTDPKNGNVFSKEIYVAFAKYQVTSVSVNPDYIEFVGVGEYAQTNSASITPKLSTSSALTNPSIKYGFFVSSNESVVAVTSNGVATPVGKGTAVITYYSYDGGYTATTNVKVTTNRTLLQSAIDKANALVEEFYTPETYLAVQEALVGANAVNNEDTTQEEINEATLILEDALSKLEKNPIANVIFVAGEGGSITYNDVEYTGEQSVTILIENGLTVSAKADDGYVFSKWVDANGNTISTNANETFAIDYSAYFKAEFEKVYSITGVKIYANGNDVEYYTKDVGTLATYTSQKVVITCDVYPSNANYFKLDYSLSNDELKFENSNVTPKNNNVSYSYVTVTATNTLTGESFSDTVCVAFAKYLLDSVTAEPNVLVFEGEHSATQTMTINYNGSGSQTPSLRRGAFKSNDTAIATVDSNGNVTPVSIGETSIVFTAFDGGKTAVTTVKVYADKSALKQAIDDILALNSEDYTHDSFSAVNSVLESANEVYNKEFATQQEVDLATSSIVEVKNTLVLRDVIKVSVNTNGNGKVLIDEQDTTSVIVDRGNSVTLKAVPDKDYMLDGWYLGDTMVSSNIEYTFNADNAVDLVAKFEPIPYISNIVTIYADKENVAPVGVSLVGKYTNYEANIGVKVYPENANYTVIGWKIGNKNVNLNMTSSWNTGCTVKPSSNDPAYGQIVVTVRDNYSGKEYEGYCYVSFAKVMVYGITVDPTEMNFASKDAPSQSISATYKGVTAVSSPSIKDCFYVSSDNNVATVSSNGTVSPVGKGNCVITAYSYDGGFTATTNVTVKANPSATGKVVMKSSPTLDTGSVPVEGAVVTIGDKSVTTGADGTFKIEDVVIGSTATVSYKTGVTRTVEVKADMGNIPLVVCDMNNDGFINAKDYVYLMKSGANQNMFNQFDSFYNTKVVY